MNAEPFHRPDNPWNTAIRHCPHDVVQRLRLGRGNAVPEGVVRALPCGIAQCGSGERRAQNPETYAHPDKKIGVLLPTRRKFLFGIKICRKPRIVRYHKIPRRPVLSKANKDRGNFLWIAQKRGFRDVAQVFIYMAGRALQIRGRERSSLRIRSWSAGNFRVG